MPYAPKVLCGRNAVFSLPHKVLRPVAEDFAHFNRIRHQPCPPSQAPASLDWLIWTWGTFLPSRRLDAPAATAWRNQFATGTSDGGTAVSPPVPSTLTPPTGTPYFGMLSWLFEEIGRWKSAEGYNDTIGQSLATIQPVLTATATATASGGSVKIGWGWQGFSAFLDLCELTVERADGKISSPSPTTPPRTTRTAPPYPATPTKWTYKAIYRVGDHQVGQWSAEVSVTVGG